jgi:hypothetical protein
MAKKEDTLAQRTIAAATKSVALLMEHRSSVIATAVTGKIDVRDASASEALEGPLEAAQ